MEWFAPCLGGWNTLCADSRDVGCFQILLLHDPGNDHGLSALSQEDGDHFSVAKPGLIGTNDRKGQEGNVAGLVGVKVDIDVVFQEELNKLHVVGINCINK